MINGLGTLRNDMAAWLSLLLAILATAGFFACFYGLVFGFIGWRRRGGKPTIGIAAADTTAANFGIWIHWDPGTYGIQIYRLRVSHSSPFSHVKEGQFSVTYDPPQKAPFFQVVELPPSFRDLMDSRGAPGGVIFTLEARTTEELVILKSVNLKRIQRVIKRKRSSPVGNRLKPAQPDPPTVSTLDYSELALRKQKLKNLADQAKAKEKAAQAAAAAAAAKAQAATVTAPAPVAKTTTTAPQPTTTPTAATKVTAPPPTAALTPAAITAAAPKTAAAPTAVSRTTAPSDTVVAPRASEPVAGKIPPVASERRGR